MHRRSKSIIGLELIVVNMLEGKRNVTDLKELFPTDALDPFADAFVFQGAFGVLDEDLADGGHGVRPTRRVVGNIRNRQAGEHRRALGIGDFTTHQQRHAALFRVEDGQGRAHGVAVAAVHAPFFVDDHGLQVLVGMRPDGASGTGTDGGGDFAQVTQDVMLHFGRGPVHAADGDVGAMHGAAHVQAAGQRDADLGRQLMGTEVVKQIVHDGFNDTGGVDGRGMAVYPTLGVDDIGDGVAGAAFGQAPFDQFGFQGFQLSFVGDQEFDVMTAGEAQVAAAVFFSDIAQFPGEYGSNQPGRGDAHGNEFGAGFGNVDQDARFRDGVIFPFTVVIFNDGRQEFAEMRGANIGNPFGHVMFSSLT